MTMIRVNVLGGYSTTLYGTEPPAIPAVTTQPATIRKRRKRMNWMLKAVGTGILIATSSYLFKKFVLNKLIEPPLG